MGADKNFSHESGYSQTNSKAYQPILPRSRSYCEATDPRNKINTAEHESNKSNTNRTKTTRITNSQPGAVAPLSRGGCTALACQGRSHRYPRAVAPVLPDSTGRRSTRERISQTAWSFETKLWVDDIHLKERLCPKNLGL